MLLMRDEGVPVARICRVTGRSARSVYRAINSETPEQRTARQGLQARPRHGYDSHKPGGWG
jgi:hypothetical protein